MPTASPPASTEASTDSVASPASESSTVTLNSSSLLVFEVQQVLSRVSEAKLPLVREVSESQSVSSVREKTVYFVPLPLIESLRPSTCRSSHFRTCCFEFRPASFKTRSLGIGEGNHEFDRPSFPLA